MSVYYVWEGGVAQIIPFIIYEHLQTMKVAILIISSLAATLAGPHHNPFTRETSVEGRQFSEDPIINYAGWGFIAGLDF